MDAYITEEQQLEAIKKWITKYAKPLLWGGGIILAMGMGVLYGRHHQEVLRQEASEHYFSLLSALAQKESITIESKASVLLAQFPRSIYATFGSFILADEAVKKGDLEKAVIQVKQILAQSQEPHFQALARVRLMQLLIAQEKETEALSYYDEKKADGFLTLMEELKGDILLKRNDRPEALKAYQKAWEVAPQKIMRGSLLKMKLEALGESV